MQSHWKHHVYVEQNLQGIMKQVMVFDYQKEKLRKELTNTKGTYEMEEKK